MAQERPSRIERRLSAILAADVAGYSRLMHHDEEATHAKLTTLLMEAVYPAIAEHGGRVVKNTGDGFLAEFASAVEAVRAAMQFQTRTHELTINEPEDNQIAFRVGINIGDVIVEPHDIFGDGVNIAARLESIAEPGGICISSSVYDHVRGKVGIEFADLGEQNLKNIALPVRTYAAVRDGPRSETQVERASRARLSTPRLSIVVLPFANLSGDREQDYFVDGVTESLTTDLSRIAGSFVISRNSAVSHKGRAVDVRQVGRELNVRYVLEGSVQRSGKRLRLNVQLIDAKSGQHLWAERFEKSFIDLFDMQDEIVSRLANTLGAQLIEAEARRAERTLHPDAMDLYFQGRAWLMKGFSPECVAQARSFFERSLESDPGNVEAMIGLANVDTAVGASFTTDDGPARFAAAEAMVNKALSIRPNHISAHLAWGRIQIFTNRAAQGVREFEHALALDSNRANAHAALGFAKFYMGCAAETEGHILEALRLSPRDVEAYQWMCYVGVAKLQLGSDVEAVSWLRRSTEANRNFPLAHLLLAAALGLTGALEEARTAARMGLALNSGFTIRRLLVAQQSDSPMFLAGLERSCEGLRLAGVPEG
ncbi:adenylate/guanylate cyclase domain-containing protein [Bradyrhizobium canariense]|uniref:adenylate/guanylate cyclase domain-containing protein n=1 Tax=Bradyrhizobium canariense TaxID=255045 RepID=UPI000A198B5F|nr:adenylate/guanylate cyclase domain-containing protein [Bradyrhizobium canariense]OSI25794.1 adenylate/guanylate cyclase domain-containing protein [Bradyrhizobium canariense]OSI34683.1 adenylate/guanylate cyclase domain-containing protein [Bradyrhizobium canariense]OSI46117.1 adenylate/guanylate cyclase domain-containing protein [Bradyrhizobium canariense]OSI53317.1 adenylate/guanylate cyclase domain-containing protein [Bradyrhizobium canariense]OSI62222.1 adenylate/guanylate cyclase domain-